MTDDRRPVSVVQLADRWGCSEGLVRKLIRAGQLQCFRPGALIRISMEEVERFERAGILSGVGSPVGDRSPQLEVKSPSVTVERTLVIPRRRRIIQI